MDKFGTGTSFSRTVPKIERSVNGAVLYFTDLSRRETTSEAYVLNRGYYTAGEDRTLIFEW